MEIKLFSGQLSLEICVNCYGIKDFALSNLRNCVCHDGFEIQAEGMDFRGKILILVEDVNFYEVTC